MVAAAEDHETRGRTISRNGQQKSVDNHHSRSIFRSTPNDLQASRELVELVNKYRTLQVQYKYCILGPTTHSITAWAELLQNY